MALLLVAVSARGQGPPGPSPPTPLTATTGLSEGPLVLGQDGSVGALLAGSVVDWANARCAPVRVELRQACGRDVVRLVAPRPEAGEAPPERPHMRGELRPAISADGARLVYWRKDPGDTETDLFLEGRSTRIGYVDDKNDLDRRSPRPHVTPSGRTVWAASHPGFSFPSDSKFFELGAVPSDPVDDCTMPNVAPGVAQPAFTPDGGFVVGDLDIKDVRHQVVRVGRGGATWCESLDASNVTTLALATLNPMSSDLVNWQEVYDATISANGRVVAFTSQEDLCSAVPRPFTDTRDLWLWYDAGLSPPPFAAQTCPAADGVGSLVRLDLDGLLGPGLLSEENFAVITPDAAAVLVVSSGSLEAFRNPNQRPSLFEVPLTGSNLSARQLSDDVGVTEALTFAMLSQDGVVVSYTLDRSALDDYTPADYDFAGDSFLLIRGRGVDAAVPDDPDRPPAGEPVDLELLGCTTSAGTVSVDLRLRQWRGGPRTVIVTGEAADAALPTVTSSFGPVVQKLTDGQFVEFRLSAPYAGTLPECSARVTIGGSSHPDVVPAWRRP